MSLFVSFSRCLCLSLPLCLCLCLSLFPGVSVCPCPSVCVFVCLFSQASLSFTPPPPLPSPLSVYDMCLYPPSPSVLPLTPTPPSPSVLPPTPTLTPTPHFSQPPLSLFPPCPIEVRCTCLQSQLVHLRMEAGLAALFVVLHCAGLLMADACVDFSNMTR